MLFVLNKCYGGWSLSEQAAEILGLDTRYPELDSAMTEKVANLIREHGSEFVSGRCARLRVVELPDNFTDYEVNEYDGIETITYVVDGKLYHA